MTRYNDYQTLALYQNYHNLDFNEDRAEQIDAIITFDEVYICGRYFHGSVKAKVDFDQGAYEDAFWVNEVVDLSGLEWVDSDGNDHNIKELEVSVIDVLQAIQALELNDKQVREI